MISRGDLSTFPTRPIAGTIFSAGLLARLAPILVARVKPLLMRRPDAEGKENLKIRD